MGGSGKGWVFMWVGGALFAALVAGFGSRSVPDPSSNSPLMAERAPASAPEIQADDEADGEEVQSISSGALILERSEDGHFYANAQINGEMIRMLVDTGASAIALSREDARRAGIGISAGMTDVIGQGASGEVHGEVVTIDRMVLGNIEAEEFEAVVLDGGRMSLLGQSFLASFDSVEIKGDQMVLR